MSATFKAIRIDSAEGPSRINVVDQSDDGLPEGDVTVRVSHSTVNYKDALAITGRSPVVRRFPMVPGIDFAGIVESSSHAAYKPGDAVVLNGWGVGETHWGGLAQKAKLKGDWLVPLPQGMTARQAMAIGTAGYTAALCVEALVKAGVTPDKGEVLVTGATGGVGSIAVEILAKAGYEVHALTGKAAAADYLKDLGAAKVVLRSELDLAKIRPLDKAIWAGAVDNLGGDVLAWMASTMKQGGTIASIGLAASHTLNTTVMPFILRGANLLGIDSGYIGEPYRSGIWQRLATDLKPPHLAAMARKVAFDELPNLFPEYLAGRARGLRWQASNAEVLASLGKR